MSRSNFRVKLDLSKFYDDVRRSSWIYVDQTEISCVCHLQKHITKVFGIQRSLHLLLDTGEYLPPNEDSRVLKENETIVVVPGTGLQDNQTNAIITASVSQINQNHQDPNQSQCNSDLNLCVKIKEPESSEDDVQNSLSETNPAETTSENTVFLSMINDSCMETPSEPMPDSIPEEEMSAPDTSILKNKRKRVRRKRSKNTTLSDELEANDRVEEAHKKPKIITSVTIPNGKHIRFGEVEEVEFQGYDSSTSNDSRIRASKTNNNRSGESPAYSEKIMAGSNLANLLALRQSSTPITFARKKTEEVIPQVNTAAKESEDVGADGWFVHRKDGAGITINPKRYPLMEDKGRINDIITFKMLKMGSNYTPQVSDYIIAQLIEILPEKPSYVFRIIDGQDEVGAPQGKFDIKIEEPEDPKTDVIALDWSQLIEPRLIHSE